MLYNFVAIRLVHHVFHGLRESHANKLIYSSSSSSSSKSHFWLADIFLATSAVAQRHRGTAYGEAHWPAVRCCSPISGRVLLMVAARFHPIVVQLLDRTWNTVFKLGYLI